MRGSSAIIDSGSVFFSKDDIKEQKSTTVFLSNDEKTKGLMSGTVETTPAILNPMISGLKLKRTGIKNS